MKRLKRMLLVNWYFFQKEVIEFDTLTFLTGKNGTGKSTIIDALQLVLLADTSGSFFNKSANGKSRRTLAGYLRGELTDDEAGGFTCLRNDRFTSYVALEFYDEEKGRPFTAGCCFDVYSASDTPHVFFGYHGVIPEDLYIVEGLPLSIEKLRRWIYAEHPESTKMITSVNKEFRDYLYGKLGGLQAKFADLFKKAVPFTPIADIQKFITEFVFGHEQPVDIRAMQETIESYTQMEQEAARLQERQTLLEEIASQHGEYRRLRAQVQANQYIAERADCDLAARAAEAKKQDLARQEQKLEQDRLALKEKRRESEAIDAQYTRVKTELASSGLQRHIEELEKARDALKQQIAGWQTAYDKRNRDFARLTANWREVLRGCGALPAEKTEVLGERTKVSLETFAQQRQAAARAMETLASKELSAIALPDAQAAGRAMLALDRGVVALQDNVEQDLREAAQAVAALVEEQSFLQAGRQRYPESVTALRRALEERLAAQTNAGASVRMVAELWDVRDQAWRNAVEGYLNTQRYNLLVAQEDYQAAAAIYDSVKDALHIHGVAVVDIAAIRRLRPERLPFGARDEMRKPARAQPAGDLHHKGLHALPAKGDPPFEPQGLGAAPAGAGRAIAAPAPGGRRAGAETQGQRAGILLERGAEENRAAAMAGHFGTGGLGRGAKGARHDPGRAERVGGKTGRAGRHRPGAAVFPAGKGTGAETRADGMQRANRRAEPLHRR